MALQSAALFQQKIKQYGLGEFADRFTQCGWSNFGDFAFSANYQPGGADESPFTNDVVEPLLGDPNHPKKAALRRLFFEAYTAMAADYQRMANQTDETDRLRNLPAAERNCRMEAIRNELVGLDIFRPIRTEPYIDR